MTTTTDDVAWRRDDELHEFASVHGGLRRVVASFAGLSDLIYMTGVHPRHLEAGIEEHGDATMLVQANDQAWTVVDQVNDCHSDACPRTGANQLRQLGVAKDLAATLTSFRVVDVDLAPDLSATRLASTDAWPLLGLPVPRMHHGKPLINLDISELAPARFPWQVGHPMLTPQHGTMISPYERTHSDTPGGSYPLEFARPALKRVVQLASAKDAPDWLCPADHARVFFDREYAASTGYIYEHPLGGESVTTIATSLGDVAVWLHTLDPDVADHLLLHPTAYTALDVLGLDANAWADRDAAPRWRRQVRAWWRGRPRDAHVYPRPCRAPDPQVRQPGLSASSAGMSRLPGPDRASGTGGRAGRG